ncbi:MAG TPA: FAD-dependent monooxygenase [Pseudonocardiaceae bacterium]|jgi:2-polyprenyl-6-methoxyphenol hydroxylase-like FAD-dependent oxidoreductase
MSVEEVPVLVIGGGMAGLSAALLLQQQGVPTMLVERHHEASPQPKARRFNLRTMEIYRALGLTEPLLTASAPLAGFDGLLQGETLATATWPTLVGAHVEQRATIEEHSPCGSLLCPQNVLEPILRAAAEQRGVDVRFGTELLDIAQDEDGVTATIERHGNKSIVRAEYVIAADGARSLVRETLGIASIGKGHLADNLDVYFRAELAELVGNRRFNLCTIDNPAVSGTFVSVNGSDRWLFSTSAHDLSERRWIDLLRIAIGVPDQEIEIISAMQWESAMRVAETFAQGRIFLAGDAAHAMPPMAASGANTAVQDVHNLAWKLGSVLRGSAPRTLLDTYQVERYPIDYATAEFSSLVSGDLATMVKSVMQSQKVDFNPWVALLGTQYEQGALIPDGRGPGPTDRLAPEGRPGIRAPHVWVRRGAERISTIDLAGPGFALLTGADGHEWLAAANECDIAGYRIGPGAEIDDPQGTWLAEVGIKSAGALLVRPDGIMAWRSVEAVDNPAATLADVLRAVLG